MQSISKYIAEQLVKQVGLHLQSVLQNSHQFVVVFHHIVQLFISHLTLIKHILRLDILQTGGGRHQVVVDVDDAALTVDNHVFVKEVWNTENR